MCFWATFKNGRVREACVAEGESKHRTFNARVSDS